MMMLTSTVSRVTPCQKLSLTCYDVPPAHLHWRVSVGATGRRLRRDHHKEGVARVAGSVRQLRRKIHQLRIIVETALVCRPVGAKDMCHTSEVRPVISDHWSKNAMCYAHINLIQHTNLSTKTKPAARCWLLLSQKTDSWSLQSKQRQVRQQPELQGEGAALRRVGHPAAAQDELVAAGCDLHCSLPSKRVLTKRQHKQLPQRLPSHLVRIDACHLYIHTTQLDFEIARALGDSQGFEKEGQDSPGSHRQQVTSQYSNGHRRQECCKLTARHGAHLLEHRIGVHDLPLLLRCVHK